MFFSVPLDELGSPLLKGLLETLSRYQDDLGASAIVHSKLPVYRDAEDETVIVAAMVLAFLKTRMRNRTASQL